jgi:3-hydroxyacyl-[acyl-carrier-protein] dehydratase
MWIDRIIELVPRERLVAIKNLSMAEEHLHDHFEARPAEGALRPLPAVPIMPASLIIEGMAQAGGLLVGHADDFRQKVVLAKISRADLSRDAGPGMTLRYTVRLARMDDAGAAVAGTVELMDHAHADRGFVPIGSIELMFSHLDNNMGAASEFPEHNFVFGDSFKTLLRISGF